MTIDIDWEFFSHCIGSGYYKSDKYPGYSVGMFLNKDKTINWINWSAFWDCGTKEKPVLTLAAALDNPVNGIDLCIKHNNLRLSVTADDCRKCCENLFDRKCVRPSETT